MLATGGTVKLPNLRTSAHTAMPPVTIFTAGTSGFFILSHRASVSGRINYTAVCKQAADLNS
jgi:hypothetical protein